jgi:hypothetical protein
LGRLGRGWEGVERHEQEVNHFLVLGMLDALDSTLAWNGRERYGLGGGREGLAGVGGGREG